MSNLVQILSSQFIYKIQDRISDKLGVSVVISSLSGDKFGDMKDCPQFCKLISSSKKGALLCEKSKFRFFKVYPSGETSFICKCHMGVKNCISPIIVNNQLLGNVVIGQFLSEEDKNNNLLDINDISNKFEIDKCKLKDATLNIPILSEKSINTFLGYSELISEFLEEITIKNIFSNKVINLENELANEKLKTLESQINPHFLFNTLNSISRMALLENSPNTLEMIYCLSDLLRYTLDDKESYPTIESEINNLEKYLFIQSIRFKDRFNFNINISEDILKLRIPSMILQPIVENAIVHGVEAKSTLSNIDILGEIENDDVKIIVKDTGVGIPPNKLNQIKINDFSGFGMGISNPQHRLKQYFGENYGLKIDSIENLGTTVEIKFPSFTQLLPNINTK